MLSKRIAFCDEHNHARMRMFCKSRGCWKYICQFCLEEFHKGHEAVDFPTLTGEIQALETRALDGKSEATDSLKAALEGLESMLKRVLAKHRELIAEEEKARFQFEKQSQRLTTSAAATRDDLEKRAKKLAGKVETVREETLAMVSRVRKEFDVAWKTGAPDAIKNIFAQHSEQADRAGSETQKERLMGEAKTLAHEVAAFEAVTAADYFAPLSPTPKVPSIVSTPLSSISPAKSEAAPVAKSRLQIQIPPVSSRANPGLAGCGEPELGRLKESLEKLQGRIAERQGALKLVEQTIALKTKEIERLDKTRTQILKANESLRISFEKQNRAFAENLEAFLPTHSPKRPSDPVLVHSIGVASAQRHNKGAKPASSSKITVMNAAVISPEAAGIISTIQDEASEEKARIQAAEKVLEDILSSIGMEVPSRTLEGMLKQVSAAYQEARVPPNPLSPCRTDSPSVRSDAGSADKSAVHRDPHAVLKLKGKEDEATIAELRKEVTCSQQALKRTQTELSTAMIRLEALREGKEFLTQQNRLINPIALSFEESPRRRLVEGSHDDEVKREKIAVVIMTRLEGIREGINGLGKALRESISSIMAELSANLRSRKTGASGKSSSVGTGDRRAEVMGLIRKRLTEVVAGFGNSLGEKLMVRIGKCVRVFGRKERKAGRCGCAEAEDAGEQEALASHQHQSTA